MNNQDIIENQEKLLSYLKSERDFKERELLAIDRKINLIKKSIVDLKIHYNIKTQGDLEL